MSKSKRFNRLFNQKTPFHWLDHLSFSHENSNLSKYE